MHIYFFERNFAQLFRIESRQTNKIIIKKTHKKAFQTKKHQQFNFHKYELKLNNFYVFSKKNKEGKNHRTKENLLSEGNGADLAPTVLGENFQL